MSKKKKKKHKHRPGADSSDPAPSSVPGFTEYPSGRRSAPSEASGNGVRGSADRAAREKARPEAKRSKDEITASLSAIYEGHPSKEWLNTLERGRRKTWALMLGSAAALLALVIGAAWLGFWWWGGRGFSGQGIRIQIEGPERIAIGQKVTYFINWFNVSGEPLASAEFRVSFPNDFLISEVDPPPTSEPLVFRLGAQAAEARGTMKVTGMFTGALGTESAVQVIGTYRPASFNSDFEELETRKIVYADSIFEGALDMPAKVLPGDEVTIRYTVKNKGTERMEGLRARFLIPEGFVRKEDEAQDAIEAYEEAQDLDPLEPGESAEIVLTGSFALGASGDVTVTAEAGYLSADRNFAAAQRTEGTISVLAGDLHIELVINGSQDDRSVNMGEWQRIAISYENTSGEELEGVSLTLRLEARAGEGEEAESVALVDWERLDDDLGGRRSGNALTFTGAEIEDLESLAPGGDGFIEVSVPILESVGADMDVPVLAYVEARIESAGGEEVNRSVKTQPVTLRLQSDASIESAARYASEEGAILGSGPLPPVVGSSTTYRIEWRIRKTIHELERVSVSASIPKGASWGSVREIDAGEAGFDPDLKLVTWSINRIPEEENDLILSFDVKVNPSEADAGRFASLLSETRFEFTDKNAGESVIRTSPSLTTDLPDDPVAKRKGVVTK
jgi:hypothetical protein